MNLKEAFGAVRKPGFETLFDWPKESFLDRKLMGAHFVIRARALGRFGGKSISVIDEHNHTLAERGEVAFGKAGARVSEANLRTLQRQIAEGHPTRLYVVVRTNDQYLAYSAELAAAGHVQGESDTYLFPAYYAEAGIVPTTTFVLKSSLLPSEIDHLRLSRGQSLMETLKRCRTSQMLVTDGRQHLDAAG